MNSHTSLNKTSLLVACALALLVGGCSPPTGAPTGRAPTTATTPAERFSPQVSITALSEQSDLTADQLAADLNDIPELNKGYRSTIVFGDIVNKTQIVPTSDFEAFRTRLRARLQQSRFLRDKVKWVENRSRVEELRRREGGSGAGVAPLNDEYTYFLNGEMYRVDRGNSAVNLYSMTYNLTNMATGEIVWGSAPYEIKQVR